MQEKCKYDFLGNERITTITGIPSKFHFCPFLSNNIARGRTKTNQLFYFMALPSENAFPTTSPSTL